MCCGYCQVDEKLVDQPPRCWARSRREPAMLGIRNGRQPQLDNTREKNSRRTCAPAAGRVCVPTWAVEPPRVRRIIRRAVDPRLPVAAPAARCAGPSGHARARGAVSAVRLPEDPDLSRAPETPDECRTDLSAAGLQVGNSCPKMETLRAPPPQPSSPARRRHFAQESRVLGLFALVSDLHRWRTCPVH